MNDYKLQDLIKRCLMEKDFETMKLYVREYSKPDIIDNYVEIIRNSDELNNKHLSKIEVLTIENRDLKEQLLFQNCKLAELETKNSDLEYKLINLQPHIENNVL
jgi:hypothetical protein